MPGSDGNDGWDKWSKWVVSALKTVIKSVDDLTMEVKGIREDMTPRMAVLEERCSADKMDALTVGVQDNKITLAKMGGAGLLGGGVAAAIFKLAEAMVAQAQAGGPP